MNEERTLEHMSQNIINNKELCDNVGCTLCFFRRQCTSIVMESGTIKLNTFLNDKLDIYNKQKLERLQEILK